MRKHHDCTLCPRHKIAHEGRVCSLGWGDDTSEIMVLKDTPGWGIDPVPPTPAGNELSELIEGIDLDINEIWWGNAVACQDPDGKAPTKSHIAKCTKWVDYQISRVRPKFILALGATPLKALTGGTGNIRKMRGKPFEYKGAIVLPTYHPAIFAHDPKMRPLVKKDFELFAECIKHGGIPKEEELDFTIVDDWDKVDAMLKDLRGTVAGDLETTRLYQFETVMDVKIRNGEATEQELKSHKAQHGSIEPPRIVSMQWGTKRHQWVVPMETAGIWTPDELEMIVSRVHKKLKKCFLVGHNWKFDALWLLVRYGKFFKCDFDTMLAHYIIDENSRHGLKELAQKYCNAVDWDVSAGDKTKWSRRNANYAAHDVYYTRALKLELQKELNLDPQIKKVFNKILVPCIEVFTWAEFDGVQIDLDKFDDAEEYLRDKLAEHLENLREWEPDMGVHQKGRLKGQPIEFNWGSPKQVGQLLFEELGIEPTELTKTGAPSVGESALKQMDHECVGDLLAFRGAKQQLSFFIEGWKPYLTPDGRLHPSFKIHGTVTGRLSCENPNLQQVPRDKRIRNLIIAIDGWDMNECDLSQIELRVAAHSADETNMILAFNTGVDVHWLTALREIERGAGLQKEIKATVQAYYKDKRPGETAPTKYGEMVECLLKDIGPDNALDYLPTWKEYRKKAKAINFGYLYGMWWKKFKTYARDNYGVEITDKQAEASRNAFFLMYPNLEPWHERQRRFARLNGYVRSLSGRKRRLPDAQLPYRSPKRDEAQRQAINSPIQSFANELNLMAAIQLSQEYGRDVCRIVGTVHDAVLFMTRHDMTEEIHSRMLEIMSRPELMDDFDITLKVPILADGEIGPWGAGLNLNKWKAKEYESAA